MLGVQKSYPAKRGGAETRVLTDVDLRVRRGEYVALVGASGSGKSTLMNLLGCLDTPSAGRYLLDGRDVSRLSAAELCAVRREKLGFVFQGFQLMKRLTALENVALPLLLRGVGVRERERRALAALGSVGLADRAAHRPGEMSGGQQQRVAVARALCYAPSLLLCDEPTGALDAQSRDGLLSLLDGLHREGRTLVVITHDPLVAARAARRYRVDEGRVLDGD